MTDELTETLLRSRNGAVDLGRIEAAVREILTSIGDDPSREAIAETPQRVARMYAELFAGLAIDPAEYLRVGFEEGHQEMVILRDVPFYSMCEHHLLPFHGQVHLGYIPAGRVVGLSKLARVVDGYAKRPQLQERLTSQIADCVMENLRPDGVAVVVRAEHLCMTMRGVKKPGSFVITSASRGSFRSKVATRSEFLSLVQGP
ncbi:MAG: GTP cyclohydrolase I FolE [Dehalococcoidia bacterium]